MNDIHISIKRKSYQDLPHASATIADLDLTLSAGEFVCLVGPSGCGKTTLLNIIAGIDKDYVGSITNTQHPAFNIGYVFQNPRLLPWCTVRKNIELVFPGVVNGQDIDDLLADMQLTQVQHEYPERLSLGMARRVAIIRAFAINPALLLMDEPFVSLDAATARQVRSLLLKLWQHRPHTVLLVTHDLRDAIALADKLIFLSANPMRVIAQIPVPIARADREDEALIEAFRQQLKSECSAFMTYL
ncbi:ABC transporter ATP-binding protein [Methylocucumis oryzae]|uniref:ABC transporter n=1 Tax=Methylocucumis oryzae TaxID=1632867 RepID=A0A0F3IN37_9GAMM|nr:ABC transporter ATP-binding protein [Methylocucumis oryzae]KJV08131.1 ABC transporter [Methylocucumis oryzae]